MATSKKAARAAALEAALAEPLPFASGVPRLAAPGADLSSDALGRRVELLADEFGIVRPSDSEAVRLADALRLPVLRAADQEPSDIAAEEADEEATTTEDTAAESAGEPDEG